MLIVYGGLWGLQGMIQANDIWVDKATGVKVLVLRFMEYMVTFQKEGTIQTKGDFEFKDLYEKEVGDE